MASIDFTVTMTDGTKMTKSAAVSDPDVGRLLAAFATKYPVPEGVSPDANFLVGKWIEDTVVTAMSFVQQTEAAHAAAQAQAAVTMIPFTIS